MSVSPIQDSRAAANAEIITSAYEAFGRGDIPAVLETLAEDMLWHVPGRGPLSRDYRGRAEVLGFFQHFTELSGGTFQIAVDEVLAKGDRVIVLVTESAERHGRNWSSPQVHAWTINDGKATVFWQFQGDQQTEDEFWASPGR
jgi:ketosteroid isomerase-like protein